MSTQASAPEIQDDSFIQVPTTIQGATTVSVAALPMASAALTQPTNVPLLPPTPPPASPLVTAKQQIRRGPAGPRKQGREIRILHEEEHYPVEHQNLIFHLWNKGFKLIAILQKLNPKQVSIGKPSVNLIDLYAFLYRAKRAGRIQQRREPSNEMSLDLFSKYYVAWKSGANREGCLLAAAPYSNKYWSKQLHLLLTARYRAENEQAKTLESQEGIKATAYELERSVLRCGQYRIVEGTAGVFLPISKIPTYLLDILKEIPHVGLMFQENASPELKRAHAGPIQEDGKAAMKIPLDEEVFPPQPKLDLKPPEVLESTPPSSHLAESIDERFDDIPLDELLSDEKRKMEEENELPLTPTSQEDFDENDPFK